MEFAYTIDPESSRPKMCLFGDIGKDESGEGIDVDAFCRELMFLDSAEPKKEVIDIWINSGGGSVVLGMQLFNTILKTKTKVDTHNVGMAASIAGPIFLAGRNRYMMDNAVFMMHPVSGGDEKSREVFESSVNTMLASRSFLTPEKISKMMADTTWLDAYECESVYGLCEVEYANGKNNPRKRPDTAAPKELWKAYQNSINNILIPKKNKMASYKEINNSLDLDDEASVESAAKAVFALKNKVKASDDKMCKMKNDLDEAEDKFKKLKDEFDKTTNELNLANTAKVAAELEAKTTEATVEITNAVKVGKIKNDAATIELWTKNYLSNPEGTKSMIAAIALNKTAPKLPVMGSDKNNDQVLLNAIGSHMAEVRNKLKI